MAVQEMFGRRGTGTSRERMYRLEGYTTENDALTALLGDAPSTLDSLTRNDDDCDVEEIEGTTTWIGIARYTSGDKVGGGGAPLEVGESRFSFDTTGGTQHITQALEHIQSYAPAGQSAPDHKGAIGVGSDGAVEGCDVIVPVYAFEETHVIAVANVDDTYKGKLFRITGRTNNASFRGFSAGEVIFLGASGTSRGDGNYEITFRFAASPNRTGLTVGTITDIAKKGWEYLWTEYEAVEDGTAHALTKRPRAAHVERVYDSDDFSDLGIGTS